MPADLRPVWTPPVGPYRRYRPRPQVEKLLRSAPLWLDAEYYDGSAQVWPNLGYGGAVLDARMGSSTTADVNDPLWLAGGADGYVYHPGAGANVATVPDSVELRVPKVDVAVRLSSSWTSGTRLVNRYSGGNFSWGVDISAGEVVSMFHHTGTVQETTTTGTPLPFVDGPTYWLRVTFDPDNGTNRVLTVYTAPDSDMPPAPGAWVLHSTGTAASTVMSLGAGAPLGIGGEPSGFGCFNGRIRRVVLKSTIGGSTVFDANFATLTEANSDTFTAQTGQTVTFNRSTSGRKLVVMPAGGRSRFLFGQDDYMDIPDSDRLDMGASDSFTVMAVVRQFHMNSSQVFFAKKSLNNNNLVGYSLWSFSPNVYIAERADGTLFANPSFTTTSPTTRNLVAAVSSPGRHQLSAAGQSQLSNNVVGSSVNSLPAKIGAYDTSSAALNGEMFAVAVFRRALDTSELAAIRSFYGAS